MELFEGSKAEIEDVRVVLPAYWLVATDVGLLLKYVRYRHPQIHHEIWSIYASKRFESEVLYPVNIPTNISFSQLTSSIIQNISVCGSSALDIKPHVLTRGSGGNKKRRLISPSHQIAGIINIMLPTRTTTLMTYSACTIPKRLQWLGVALKNIYELIAALRTGNIAY
jgi:hypothetical protein